SAAPARTAPQPTARPRSRIPPRTTRTRTTRRQHARDEPPRAGSSLGHDPDPARHPLREMGHAMVVVRLARLFELVLERGARLRDVHLLPHTRLLRVVRRDRVPTLARNPPHRGPRGDLHLRRAEPGAAHLDLHHTAPRARPIVVR